MAELAARVNNVVAHSLFSVQSGDLERIVLVGGSSRSRSFGLCQLSKLLLEMKTHKSHMQTNRVSC